MFCTENDFRVWELRKRLDDFYASTQEYTDFQESNCKPDFWQPIKQAVQECIESKKKCWLLEFGAGRTGFGSYLENLRTETIFHVQDITTANEDYLTLQADKIYICDLSKIDQKYDIIFSTFVWEHITDPKAVLNHLLNLLNPGGKLFIASPRYDFPFYLSPSIRHLSTLKRLQLSLWLIYRRLLVIIKKNPPDFLIHLDPALFHRPFFVDADAIHWVSLWDLKHYLPSDVNIVRLRIPAKGIKVRIWEKFCLLFVQIQKV